LGMPKRKADGWAPHILETQEKHDFIGIYTPELRYCQSRGSGELWTEACVSRGLPAYYELTGKMEVLNAVDRAVLGTNAKYGLGKLSVFGPPGARIGIGHDLMFTDALERL
jgi:hypothetical protein